MKRNWYQWCDLLFRVLPYTALALVVVILVIMALCFPPVIITLTLFGAYALIDLMIWLVKRELEKGPADAPEDRMIRKVLFALHVAAIVVLGGILIGFFRWALEHSDLDVWEVAGIYLCGGLIALLLGLRRRRKNEKEAE